MHTKKIPLLLILFISTILLYACVNQQTPEGGPKDTTPPKMIGAYPTHESINYQGKKIKITFDKDIAVEDIYSRLIVMPKLESPKGKKAYTYTVSGSTLQLNLTMPLKKDTTYNFSFNNGIKDLTEGNKAENTILTFSTGGILDACTIEGEVKDLLKNTPLKDVRVMLYYIEPDSKTTCRPKDSIHTTTDVTVETNTKEKEQEKDNIPDYFTKTDKEGKFKLSHIRAGQYTIRASNGESEKFNIDYQKDSYGFLPDPIDIQGALKGITIPMVKGDVSDFKLVRTGTSEQFFEIICSKPIISYSLTAPHKLKKTGEPPVVYSHLQGDQKIIRVYNTLGLLEEDSIEAKLIATDVIGNQLEEKITIQFKEGQEKKEALKCSIKPSTGTTIMPEFKGIISFNKPLKAIIPDSICFVYNKGEPLLIDSTSLQLNAQRDEITITQQLPWQSMAQKQSLSTKKDNQEHTITLHIPTGSVIAADKEKNEASSYNYTFKEAHKHGTIKGEVVTKGPGFIIQLLNKDYEVLDEIRNEKDYAFKMVPKGTYKVRILVLSSADGEWSFGNIRKNIPPDHVVFYPEEVAVVDNWEMGGINFKF